MRFVIALVVSVFALAAQALPKVEVEKVNGFEVHYVDVGAGNTVGVIAYVPVGTLHESHRLLGRAHLLEHLLHKGTQKYPGYHTFDLLLKEVGLNTNAYTSYEKTFYFASSEASQVATTLPVFFSMFGGLEWNEETFQKERGVVIEEIVDQGMQHEGKALFWMPYVHLLPENHPWSQPILGDRESLQGLSIADMKELYYQNYNPEFVRFAVIGNFSDPAYFQQVKQITHANLAPARLEQDPHQFKPKSKPLAVQEIPSMFSSRENPKESQSRIYLESDKVRLLVVKMEAELKDLKLSPAALRALVSYLNSSAPGSFVHHLTTEKNWLSEGGGFQAFNYKDKVHLMFWADLTEEGMNHRHEVIEHMYSALRDVQLNGPDAEYFGMLKLAGAQSMEQTSRSVDSLMNSYGSILAEDKSFIERIEEGKNVPVDDVAKAARLFRPEKAMYTEMGPKIDGMTLDTKFNRHFKIEDNRAALSRYQEILAGTPSRRFVPKPNKVALRPVTGEPVKRAFVQSKPLPDLVDRFTTDFRTDLPDSAALVSFEFGPSDLSQLVAVDLMIAAFNERFNGELTYLALKENLRVGLTRRGRFLTATASGPGRLSPQAVEWLLNALRDFKPEVSELERAKANYIQQQEGEYATAFTSTIAIYEALHRLNPFSLPALRARDLAAKLSVTQVESQWSRLIKYSHQNVTLVGALTPTDYVAVHTRAREFSPRPLPINTVQRLKNSVRLPIETAVEHQNFPEPRGKDSFALARMYAGPSVADLRDFVAMKALNEVLSMHVTNHNRGDQSLGYVHDTALIELNGVGSILMMFGQTEGPENAKKTVAGWDFVLDSVTRMTDKELKVGLDSLINSLNQVPNTAAGWAGQYSGYQSSYRNARAVNEIKAILAGLKPEDLRQVARKYLLGPDTPHESLILGDCESLLKKEIQ